MVHVHTRHLHLWERPLQQLAVLVVAPPERDHLLVVASLAAALAVLREPRPGTHTSHTGHGAPTHLSMAEGMVEETQEPSHFIISMSSSQVLISSLALLNSSLVMWILLARVSQVLSSLGSIPATAASSPSSTGRPSMLQSGHRSVVIVAQLHLCWPDSSAVVAGWRRVYIRASNEGSRRFHNHRESPYQGLHLVESTY